MTQHVYPGDRRLARQHLRLGHFARAYELDPSLRPRRPAMTADAATAERMVARAVRKAFDATMHRLNSSRNSKMLQASRGLSAFESNRLFQRSPGDSGYREPRRRHAFDAEPDEAVRHLRRAISHVESVRAGESDLDPERLLDYLEGTLEVLRVDAEDEEEDEEVDRDLAERIPTRSTIDLPGGRPDGIGRDRGRRARDGGVGETRPRSVVRTTSSREIDHRNDFRSIKAGGADSALAFDANRLFQRGGR